MVEMIRRIIYSFFHHIKLKQKLLITFFALLIVPLGILYLLTYSKITSILEHNIFYSTSQNFEQTHSFLSYKFYKIIKSSDVITLDDKVHQFANTDFENYDPIMQIDDMNRLQGYLSSFEDQEDVIRVKLYVPDGLIFSDENLNLYNITQIYHTEWYLQLLKEQSQLLFCPTEYLDQNEPSAKNTLSLARTINNPNDYSKVEGLLRMDFDKRSILAILQKSNPIKNSFTFIENSRGILVVSSDDQLQLKYGIYNKTISAYNGDPSSLSPVVINGDEFFVVSKPIDNTDWTMTTVVPNQEIIREIQSQRNGLLIIILVIAVAAYILAYLIAYFITRRIDALVIKMQAIPKGQFESIEDTHDLDEIGSLVENYNFMVHKMTSLMEDQYLSGQLLKTAELKAIQAQINPHFLYNTLEMINWMAKKNKTAEILTVTKALSQFYKLSLNKGKDLISLQDEIKHVEAYIHIQNMRFNQKIHFSVTMESSLSHFIVPKIILQPLVENAIIHGILEKPDQEGHLEIKVYEEGDTLPHIVIEVVDDGVGMSPEQLDLLLVENDIGHNDGSIGSHYGVKNINDRLSLMYNHQSSLTYISEKEKGTTVRIVLPLLNIETNH